MSKVISSFYIKERNGTAVTVEKIDGLFAGQIFKDVDTGDVFEISAISSIRYLDVEDNDRYSNFTVKGKFNAKAIERVAGKSKNIVQLPSRRERDLKEM